jgi:LEA14-like dessication related protein
LILPGGHEARKGTTSPPPRGKIALEDIVTNSSKLALGFALAVAACAPALKPPTLQVQSLKKGKVGITGATLDVIFGVRNPNPDDLAVDKMEFELLLNGNDVGRGFVAEPFTIRGFAEEKVVSTVDVSYLRVPGAIKAVLDDDEVRAEARGVFYVRQGGGLKKLDFDSDARVSLGREN